MRKIIFSVSLLAALLSCSRGPYHTTNKVYKKQARAYAHILETYPLKDSGMQFVGTTNFSMRAPNFVVIHHTAQKSCEQTLKTFTLKRTQVSSHYVVCESGTVFHMLHDMLRAHHAGVSRWGSFTDLNSASIGIEVDNDGSEPFTEAQISSLLALLKKLKTTYHIPTGNFWGHADVAPGRKVDPSRYFPWQRLAEEGFGYWYDTTQTVVPDGFDGLMALRTLGYNTAKPEYAIQSYKIHFNPTDTTKTLNETDAKILTSLLEKYK